MGTWYSVGKEARVDDLRIRITQKMLALNPSPMPYALFFLQIFLQCATWWLAKKNSELRRFERWKYVEEHSLMKKSLLQIYFERGGTRLETSSSWDLYQGKAEKVIAATQWAKSEAGAARSKLKGNGRRNWYVSGPNYFGCPVLPMPTNTLHSMLMPGRRLKYWEHKGTSF